MKNKQKIKVYFAPMEGLADPPLRKVLCPHGGYDWCFSEFIRVTDEGVSSLKTQSFHVEDVF